MVERRRGLGLGLAAYLLWGGFPLYFPLLEPGGAREILAHRIVWSSVTLAVAIIVVGRVATLRTLMRDRRQRWLLTIAAVVLALNWVTYIWGVNNGRVIETSLGYFINPLVTVLLGIVVFGERLRPAQWAALTLGAVAVAVLTLDYGRLPWVALVLACSFGTYGLMKKSADAGAIESLAFETAVLSPGALAYLGWLTYSGTGTFLAEGGVHTLLLLSTGVVTAVPLLCFSAAATRIPLVALGLLQYVAPVIQFALGLWWFGEEVSPGRWVGFSMVWLALVILTVEGIRHHRRQLRDAALAAAL